MATTNIHSAKHTDGRPVKEADICVGLVILGPSWTDGVLRYECIAVDAHEQLVGICGEFRVKEAAIDYASKA